MAIRKAHRMVTRVFKLMVTGPLVAAATLFVAAAAVPARAQSVAKGFAAYNKGDFKRAYAIWKPLAERGNSSAQFNLGGLYDAGEGVSKNYSEAAKWFRKAAEQGNAGAQFNLGNNIKQGLGQPADESEAVHWLTKASEQGLGAAQFNLAMIYHRSETRRNYEKARHWYERAAAQDHINAMVNLGTLFKNGFGGPRNNDAAVKYYRMAADRGNMLGLQYLGDMYDWGQGVEKDQAEAVRLYRAAVAAAGADHTPRELLFWLAVRYRDGIGAGADRVQALLCAKLAARAGMKTEWTPGRDLADAIAKTMTGAQIEASEVLFMSWKPGTPLPVAQPANGKAP